MTNDQKLATLVLHGAKLYLCIVSYRIAPSNPANSQVPMLRQLRFADTPWDLIPANKGSRASELEYRLQPDITVIPKSALDSLDVSLIEQFINLCQTC
jgi:hypothetical protein